LAISDNNLIPVLAEPDENTLNIDISGIESLITAKTKAILVVHLYGSVCWGEDLVRLAEKYDLKIIEDNAQAIGAKWIDGRRSGNLGDAAGLSFYPGKNLGALGDSGAVSTNDDHLTEVIRSIANYGSVRKYVNHYKGLNSRMDEIQAAFLNIKLRYLDTENSIRREIAGFYRKSITNPKVKLPSLNMDFEEGHIWHLFVIRTKERDHLQKYLEENNIQTLIHYPIPPHKQKCYQEYSGYELPVTLRIAAECLSLPISPVMTTEEVERVVEILNNW
jgi:dTDP-4-amino-4,6-dideoxygalactose transaminase